MSELTKEEAMRSPPTRKTTVAAPSTVYRWINRHCPQEGHRSWRQEYDLKTLRDAYRRAKLLGIRRPPEDRPAHEWRRAPGYDCWISVDGAIIDGDGMAIRPQVRLDGWAKAAVRGDDGQTHTVYRSRLACLAWHGLPPSRFHEVDHVSGDRTDDRPCNLQWLTRQENQRRAEIRRRNWRRRPNRIIFTNSMREAFRAGASYAQYAKHNPWVTSQTRGLSSSHYYRLRKEWQGEERAYELEEIRLAGEPIAYTYHEARGINAALLALNPDYPPAGLIPLPERPRARRF